MPEALAEVIESSTRQFVAEVCEDTGAPPFGAWVEVPLEGGTTLYGLVSHVEVGSRDASRRAMAYGLSREDLQREMPQVHALLCTTFRAQIAAHRDARGAVRQTLPPHPAGIHDFAYACDEAAVQQLGPPYDFLRTLVQSPDPAVPVDDLLVAVLRQMRAAHGGTHGGEKALIEAGRTLSRLLDDDHERLHSILRRVA